MPRSAIQREDCNTIKTFNFEMSYDGISGSSERNAPWYYITHHYQKP